MRVPVTIGTRAFHQLLNKLIVLSNFVKKNINGRHKSLTYRLLNSYIPKTAPRHYHLFPENPDEYQEK